MRWRSRALFSAAGCWLVALLLVALLPCGCGRSEWSFAATHEYEASTAVLWMDRVCGLCRDEAISPPESSRLCAYTGVALYEAVVGGTPARSSLAGRLKGMPEVPQPEPGSRYDWPSCAIAAVSTTVTGLLDTIPARTLAAIEELRISQLAGRGIEGVPLEVLERSIVYGDGVAEAVLAWASSDGYRETRGLEYTQAADSGSAPALEPYWGSLRPYVIEPDDLRLPSPPPEHLDDPGPNALQQARAVEGPAARLDEKQPATNRLSGGESIFCLNPSCDWLSIENRLAVALGLRLDEAAEMYALAGVAMGDAYILCWTERYRSSLLRPVACADRDLDADWIPAVPASQFPGHASVDFVVAGAVSRVLSCLLGEKGLAGQTHVGMECAPRCYESICDAAEGAATSPFYGDIDYLMAMEEGIERGRCVGQLVINRVCPWHLADAGLAKPGGAGAAEISTLGWSLWLDRAFPLAAKIPLPVSGTC